MKQKLSDYGINGDDNSKEYSNPKTAVEWLENEFQEMCKDFGGLHTDFIERFKQAKAMEKEQIEDAYLEGQINWEMNSKQYYNENFKSE